MSRSSRVCRRFHLWRPIGESGFALKSSFSYFNHILLSSFFQIGQCHFVVGFYLYLRVEFAFRGGNRDIHCA